MTNVSMNAVGSRPEDRVGVFMDGPNLYAATKSLGFDIDYKKFRNFFTNSCNLIRISYYTATRDDAHGDDFQTIRPLLDWLDYNGFNVVTKEAKVFDDAMGRRRIKGSMDIDIAVDMLESAHFLDHAVLFTGDGDFLPLVQAMKRRGVRVTICSALRPKDGSAQMVADELRRAADHFVDLAVMQKYIAREEGENGPDRQPPQDRRQNRSGAGGGTSGVNKTLSYGR